MGNRRQKKIEHEMRTAIQDLGLELSIGRQEFTVLGFSYPVLPAGCQTCTTSSSARTFVFQLH